MCILNILFVCDEFILAFHCKYISKWLFFFPSKSLTMQSFFFFSSAINKLFFPFGFPSTHESYRPSISSFNILIFCILVKFGCAFTEQLPGRETMKVKRSKRDWWLDQEMCTSVFSFPTMSSLGSWGNPCPWLPFPSPQCHFFPIRKGT